ncbi:MAG: hypothetical protein K2O15_07445 [Lachnospiraceae bacterium]|nr:hypothetical protein [Lachnospiraceae bacterium]
MSMEINGGYNHSTTKYVEEAMRKKAADSAENAKAADRAEGSREPAKAAQPQDEYINSEKAGAKPAGLYRVGQDENGNRKIFYDDPKKSRNADGREQPKAEGDAPAEPGEKCTTDTDKVDREIRKLKEKKQQLERQLRSAAGDEKKTGELEKKLAQVESELGQKDTDTYRRQHASVSQ